MKSQMSNTGFIPREIAILFLTSKHSKTASFRKRCFRALERVCEPVSRSTTLPVRAPKTGSQRLQSRLVKATAAQLHRWTKRTLARGNRYQNLLAECEDNAPFESDKSEHEAELGLLTQQIAAHDGLIVAIQSELQKRSTRGNRKPIKWSGVNPPPLADRDSEGENTQL